MTVFYEVQCFKIWKGVDPVNPRWENVNFVSTNYNNMQGIADQLQRVGGNPHRVVQTGSAVENDRKAPWWKFWNPMSGPIGGGIIGLIIMAVFITL